MVFDLVVVGYNTAITEAPAVLAGQQSDLVRTVFFCDNSTDEQVLVSNARYRETKTTYLPMGGNRGLSRAYNRAISMSTSPYVVIFDDDTTVAPRYFEHVARWLVPDTPAVYLPVVRVDSRPFSPSAKDRFGRTIPLADTAHVPTRMTAINSGMVVTRGIYEAVHYNERLLVDFIDHDFMDRVREHGFRMTVMQDVFLDQSFSLANDSQESAWRRFETFRRDSRVYHSSLVGSFIGRGRVALRWLKLARQSLRGWFAA